MKITINKPIEVLFANLKENYPETKLGGKNLSVKKGNNQFQIKQLEDNEYSVEVVPSPIFIILAYVPGIILMIVLGELNAGIVFQFLGMVLTTGILIFLVKLYLGCLDLQCDL
jgi:hypothetical protein